MRRTTGGYTLADVLRSLNGAINKALENSEVRAQIVAYTDSQPNTGKIANLLRTYWLGPTE